MLEDAQERVAAWVLRTFGFKVLENKQERGLRLIEECLELGQVIGLDIQQVHKLVDYVYSRPVGVLSQEFGGVGVTVLAAAESCGVNFFRALNDEIVRIETAPKEKFQKRNMEKSRAGVGNYDEYETS